MIRAQLRTNERSGVEKRIFGRKRRHTDFYAGRTPGESQESKGNMGVGLKYKHRISARGLRDVRACQRFLTALPLSFASPLATVSTLTILNVSVPRPKTSSLAPTPIPTHTFTPATTSYSNVRVTLRRDEDSFVDHGDSPLSFNLKTLLKDSGCS